MPAHAASDVTQFARARPRFIGLHHPVQSRFQDGVIAQRREQRQAGQAELQFSVNFNNGRGAGRISHLLLIILLTVLAHRSIMWNVSAANDFSTYDFLMQFSLRIGVLDFEINRFAFKQRQQALLSHRIITVVLLQNLECAAAMRVAQDDRVRLDVRGGVSKADLVGARF